jgi:hypothetical protein
MKARDIPVTSTTLPLILSVLENRMHDKEFLDVNINVVLRLTHFQYRYFIVS